MSAASRHPDTISDLTPDCRRVLRDAFARVQVARQQRDVGAIASATEAYRAVVGEWADGDSAWAERVYGAEVPEAYRAPAPRQVPLAIIEYKREAERLTGALIRAEMDRGHRQHHISVAEEALATMTTLESDVRELADGEPLLARYAHDCERARALVEVSR